LTGISNVLLVLAEKSLERLATSKLGESISKSFGENSGPILAPTGPAFNEAERKSTFPLEESRAPKSVFKLPSKSKLASTSKGWDKF